MVTSEPAEDGGPGFVPYRMSWLAAGRQLLAPSDRESAAGQLADAYVDLHARTVIFPDVPDAVRALARHVRIAVVANADRYWSGYVAGGVAARGIPDVERTGHAGLEGFSATRGSGRMADARVARWVL
jgi:hypothetical protein